MSNKVNEENTVNTNEELENNKEPKESQKTDEKKARKEKVAQKELNKKVQELENELSESQDRYVRMLAEYDNFRKRAAKEKDSMYSEGISDSVEKLLSVLDNLERAAAVDPEKTTSKDVIDGVVKILDQAKVVFESMGVTEIPAKNEKFDPNVHNAVMHDQSDEYEENTISDVFLKGYKLGDKVIRHSMVKVMN